MPPTTLVYVGTENGLAVLSSVGGQWRPLPRGLPGRSVIALATPGENAALFYAAARGEGVYRSEDTGLNWAQVLPAGVSSLLLDPADERRLWAGLEPAGLFRSDDGGQTWQDLSPGLLAAPGADDWDSLQPQGEPGVATLAAVPARPGALLAGIQVGGLLRSVDGGASWSPAGEGLNRDLHGLAVHPRDPRFWLAATGGGVYRSADGGGTWAEASQGLSLSYILAVQVLPSGVCLAVGAGVAPGNWVENDRSVMYRSADGAETWQAVALPQADYLTALAADAHAPASVYAGAESGRVYLSQDQGQTWRQISQVPAPVKAILVVRLG